MIHSNQRIFKKLKKDSNKNVQKKMDLTKKQTLTKSVRIKFWSPNKKLFLSLNKGIIETISKQKEEGHLSKNVFMNIRDQITCMKYLPFDIKKKMNLKKIWTVQCPSSIWFVNLESRMIVGGGRLDKRLAKNEQIKGAYLVHDDRVLCLITNQSRAILLLIRQADKNIELVFLDKTELAIKDVTNHAQFGK